MSNVFHLNAPLKGVIIQLVHLLQVLLTKCLLIQKKIFVDESSGPISDNTISCLDCEKFHGYESVKHESSLKDLTETSLKVFNLLLAVIPESSIMGGAAKNRRAKKIKLQQDAQESKTITAFFNKQTKPEPIDAQSIQQPAVVLQLDKLIEEQEYSVDYPDDHDRSVSLNIEQPDPFTNEDDTMDNMEGKMFLDVEGGSDWVDIVGYYCLIIGKITNKGSGYCWLVGYENVE
ncbi:hypothetical protein QTP88_001306 [Uroleucon formosanum]